MKKGNARFCIIPARAVSDKSLTRTDIMVLNALGIFGDSHGWCFPSLANVADMIISDRSNVSKSIKKLAEKGYIEIQKRYRDNGGQTSNKYRILFDSKNDESGGDSDFKEDERPVGGGNKPPLAGEPTGVGESNTGGLAETTRAYNKEITTHNNDPHKCPSEDDNAILTNEICSNEDLDLFGEEDKEAKFERFWSKYPRKERKSEARKHFEIMLKWHRYEVIIEGLERYIRNKPATEAWALACNWLSKERFKEKYESGNSSKSETQSEVEEDKLLNSLKNSSQLIHQFNYQLIKKISLPVFRSWFESSEAHIEKTAYGVTYTLYAKSNFVKNYIENNYVSRVRSALENFGNDNKIIIKVKEG